MDLRIVKTRELITDTFLDYLNQMEFPEITVKCITQTARINRSTFYKHFADKYQLRDYVLDELLKDFETNLETDFLIHKNLGDEAYFKELKQSLENFGRHKREYEILWHSMMLGRNLFEEMIETGASKIENQIRENPHISKDRKRFAGWYARLLMNNLLVSVRWWFSQEKVSAEELTHMVITHMLHGTIPTLMKK